MLKTEIQPDSYIFITRPEQPRLIMSVIPSSTVYDITNRGTFTEGEKTTAYLILCGKKYTNSKKAPFKHRALPFLSKPDFLIFRNLVFSLFFHFIFSFHFTLLCFISSCLDQHLFCFSSVNCSHLFVLSFFIFVIRATHCRGVVKGTSHFPTALTVPQLAGHRPLLARGSNSLSESLFRV